MPLKTLIFFCEVYPYGKGEFFIDDELRVIASNFKSIEVFSTNALHSSVDLNRFIPQNAHIHCFNRTDFEQNSCKAIFNLMRPFVLKELLFMLRSTPVKLWFSALKVMLLEVHRAKRIEQYLLQILQTHNLNPADCIFYDYWHDYIAMAMAFIHRKFPQTTCIARAHRWDVFATQNGIPYLPFKTFTINNLTKTFSISQAGKSYFGKYVGSIASKKVSVSQLGKFNHRTPLFEKSQNNTFTICSCSHFSTNKRVHLIVEILSELTNKNIRWVHFGYGLPNEVQLIENQIHTICPTLNYELKGLTPNDKILDFYAENYVDLFINVSSSEGIPVSIMEAISAGIPVVATNVGGNAEAVPPQVGFVIEKDFNPALVAKTIDAYLESSSEEQTKRRQNAYQFWQENFEAGKNYTEFKQMLNNL